MIRITFKDVGQGDSIILEWNEGKDRKIGLIDCNLKRENEKTTNPVLLHIIENKYSKIEFVILSHPHFDHYSGLGELFEYCYYEGILIKNFIHTCSQVVDYIKSALKSVQATKEIIRVFKLAKKLRDEKGMNEGAIQASPFLVIPLNQDIKLKFLSPTSIEHDAYVMGEKYYSNGESPHNNPNANWLSTIVKIFSNNAYVLLTSDAEKKSLVRIDKKHSEELDDKIILGQSPHHGAFGNHNNSFWKKRKREEFTPIVFSVGLNHYNHPSKKVINFFQKNGYIIYATNKVGGLIATDAKTKELSGLLDNVSNIAIEVISNKLIGDKVFEFDGIKSIVVNN